MTEEEISEVVNQIVSSWGFQVPAWVITGIFLICQIVSVVVKYKKQTTNSIAISEQASRLNAIEKEQLDEDKRITTLESRTTTNEDNIETLAKNNRNVKVQNLTRKTLNESAKAITDLVNTSVEAANEIKKAKRLRKRGE